MLRPGGAFPQIAHHGTDGLLRCQKVARHFTADVPGVIANICVLLPSAHSGAKDAVNPISRMTNNRCQPR
jgi:hypothetical protein